MAHAYISQAYDIESLILYFDDISHQENRALVKKLAIEMVRYESKLDTSTIDAIVYATRTQAGTWQIHEIAPVFPSTFTNCPAPDSPPQDCTIENAYECPQPYISGEECDELIVQNRPIGITSSSSGSIRFVYDTHRTYRKLQAECVPLGGPGGEQCTWANELWKVEYDDLYVGWPTGSGVDISYVGVVAGGGINPSAATIASDALGQIHIGFYEPSQTGGTVVKYALIGSSP